MIIATPGLATPGARTPGSVAAAPYTGFPAGYAYGTTATYPMAAAMTPQPMQISTTPGYVTPGGYSTVGGHATPSSSSQQRPSQSKNAGMSPRPASRNQQGKGRPAPGRSAEDWMKMAADWRSNKAAH